uniref:HIT domain-containing protein n=1 Tax=Oryza nivara TaxID=4536 RepID=A0A0E0J636_ORYNI
MDPVAGSRYRFGPHEIAERQVFRTSPLSFAISLVKRFADLSPDETRDLWIMAKDIGVRVEQYQRASSLTFTIQDGPHSGQTVPHVHVHILPRRKEDFENNDNNNGMMNAKNETLDLDIERKDRTMEEMAQEAKEYQLITLNYEEQIIGVYGFQQIRSRTMTKAMIIAQSTFGWTSRLKTSSARVSDNDAAPAFFLVILATSSPPLLRILQLLLLKLPSIEKAGTWPVRSDDAWVHPDMCTSAS